MKFIRRYWIAFAITVIYFLVLLFTLKDYGMHEDNPFHFLRGQAYLQKILTNEPQFKEPNLKSPVFFSGGQRISLYKPNASEELLAPIRSFGIIKDNEPTIRQEYDNFLKTSGKRESFYKHNTWTSNYWNTVYAGHPAVSDIIMALSNRIFFERLGIMPDIDSYHLYVIFSVSLMIFFVYIFVQEVFGMKAALFSAVGLALFPYLFAESHFNIKDPVQMSYFSIAVISFYFWAVRRFPAKWFVVFILAVFLALGTKWNIAFLPLIIFPWLFFIRKNKEIKFFLTKKNVLVFGSLMLVIPFILLIIAWPFLWTDTISRLQNTFGFYSSLAVKDLRIEEATFSPLPFGLDGQAFVRIFSMAPPVMLCLWIVGIVGVLGKKIRSEFRAEWLLIFWLIVPLLRVIWQGSSQYGSIRNFVEYLPAFVIISGIGAGLILDRIKNRLLIGLIFLIYFSVLAFNIIKIHPNENVYFNFLVNGLKGAQKSGVYSWEGSYDNVYKQGIIWLNKNLPKKAKLAYLDGTMMSISPLWLRDDIRFGSYFSGYEQKGEYVISLVYPDPPHVFPYFYLDRFLKPIYEIKIEGVSLLKIWKNDPDHLNSNYKNQVEFKKNIKVKRYTKEDKKIWEINFPRDLILTKIILKYGNKECTDKNVVWSLLNSGQERYLFPDRINREKGQSEFLFPAEKSDGLRFWDVEGNSCLYSAVVQKIFYLDR